jgi:hypothetical protein
MAALMWNHAPAMWGATARQGVTVPATDEQQAADLFVFFFSAGYFETPGDSRRGKQHAPETAPASPESGQALLPGGYAVLRRTRRSHQWRARPLGDVGDHDLIRDGGCPVSAYLHGLQLKRRL